MNDTPAETVPPVGAELSRLAQLRPDEPAVTCDGTTVTRGGLDSSSNRLARAYRELGVRQGDYVTIMLPNSIEWLQGAVAAWKLGAIVQPLSARLPRTELDELLALVPRALLVGRDDPRGEIPSVPRGFVPSARLSDAPLPVSVSPAVKAMASGGSTGRPKLIESTDGGRIAAELGAPFGLRESDTQLVPGPLTHNFPLSSSLLGLLLGQHIVMMSRFDPERFLRLIAEYRVTWTATVPTALRRSLPVYRADPEAYDLSSLRYLWHMAEPCPPAVKQAWIDVLGPDVVWELYGGTESQALTFISGTDWLSHRGSVGTVVKGQMRILDEDGNECPTGTVGEIFMRPPEGSGPTYRYIGSEPATRDGWDTIGDLGWFDDDGFLYLNDRRVDMLNSGGRKVYPAEIESALVEHPDVLSCLVVGVPDDELGQVPYALVEAAPNAGLDDGAVRSFLEGRIAAYKVPRHVEFRSEPLRDEAGKARRSAVRSEVLDRMAAGMAGAGPDG